MFAYNYKYMDFAGNNFMLPKLINENKISNDQKHFPLQTYRCFIHRTIHKNVSIGYCVQS